MNSPTEFIIWFSCVALVAMTMGGCGTKPSPAPALDAATPMPVAQKGDETMTFALTSSAFAQGERIPTKYTCNGEDISPPLQWSNPPQGAQSFALIMDDPDAPVGTWVHWVLFNLPANIQELPEQATPPTGSQEGRNSWGRTGYGGPCPPSGTHRYFFKLYALDTTADLTSSADKTRLLKAMEGHILAQAEVMGTYSR
jgi:Raf kinase inhibitor-like YbhB/YbcL family protein